MTVENKTNSSAILSKKNGITCITCCKDCTRRHYMCHSHCDDYITERALLDKYNEDIRRENQFDAYNKQIAVKIKTHYAKKRLHFRHFPN